MLVYGSYIQVPNLGVTLFDSYSYDGVSAGIWVIHTGPKSGGELVTLFDSYCPQSFGGGGLYSSGNGLLLWSVVGYFYEVWLQIWCKLVTLFDSYSYDGVSAGIWVLHTGPKSGGSW